MAVGERLFGEIKAAGRGSRRLRQRDLPVADLARNGRGLRASGGAALPRLRPRRVEPVVVGLVLVSHSARLAEGAAELAREMGGPEIPIEPAGGLEEPGALGTDAARVLAAIERAAGETACWC